MKTAMAEPPTTKPEPRLPYGTSSSLSGISENFSFHASPEAFITSRLLQLSRTEPELFSKRDVIRVKILNRNVAIVSSYSQIQEILKVEDAGARCAAPAGLSESNSVISSTIETDESLPTYVATPAYNRLMAPFFPPPNLLLADGLSHESMRVSWDDRIARCHAGRWKEQIRTQVEEFILGQIGTKAIEGEVFDLYEKMKLFSWQILFKCFLDLSADDTLFAEMQQLQETLLRGQFSLVPVSINAGFWKSPRAYGISAREKLQVLILRRLNEQGELGPFGKILEEDMPHVVNHVLMMTSSLAVKGLASLLTALFLNVFTFRTKEGRLLSEDIIQTSSEEQLRQLLRSTYLETERLSPPIVGIMRRSTRETIIHVSSNEDPDILVPEGWDVWLYFVGGGRDMESFGLSCNLFDPRRYLDGQVPTPLGFGLGSKTCLGQSLIRDIVLDFVERCLVERLRFQSVDDLSSGVKGWLGWTNASADQWAADMKQLPTQHPVKPVFIKVEQAR